MTSTTNTPTLLGRYREHALGVAAEQHSFDARTEADRGGRRTAQRFDQTVVPPTATDRVLRGIERAALELEGGVRVVVEPAHQPWLDARTDPRAREALLHSLELFGSPRTRSRRESAARRR